jgi:hypothetical protein
MESEDSVKVVQHLPVGIRLRAGEGAERRLRPGMSVVPKAWVNWGRLTQASGSTAQRSQKAAKGLSTMAVPVLFLRR